ncbi:MAG: TonB-dependent receptor, partial [Pyrinomonadaceae bacterium]|nr:TonB-dependent receptor [Pyrinomonadaceae bacterium]
LDNNDDRAAEGRFQPPIDSIAEIQVITNQFSAEYGRASGGRINLRTKAGARKFRGRVFVFFEDDNLNANTYNNNRRGLSRLPFTEWEPGFSASGPIPFGYFKDKTYFFSSYAYRDRDAATQIFSAVPVDQNPNIPLPMPTDPGSSRPDTNDPGAPLIANYRLQVPTPSNRHRFTQRIDHNFTDRHNITFNYQLGRSEGFRQYRETTRFLESTLRGRVRDNDSFYITDNWVITSQIVNQARFQWSQLMPDFSTQVPANPVILLRVRDETLFGNPDRINGTVVALNSTTGNANLRNEKRYQFQNTLNVVTGAHNLRFGVDVQNIDSNINELGDSTGTYNFNFVSEFLANSPSRFRLNFGTESVLDNTYYGVFFQDDWKVTENLMLAFGMRYERETILNDKNNWGPRLALAYSPGESGKSVIRAGFGVFYNRTLLRTVDDFLIDAQQSRFDSRALSGPSDTNCPSNPMDTSDKCTFLRWLGSNLPNAPSEAEIRLAPGIANIDAGFIFDDITRMLEDNIKIPESYQFNVGYERELGNSFAMEANFTYSKAVRLWREQNINAHIVPAGFANFTDYLLSLGDVTILGTSSGTDTYRFVLGDPADPNGDAPDGNPMGDCNSSTPLCIVNLNTLNGSESTLEPIGIALRVLDATLNRPISNQFRQLEQVGSRGKSVYEGLSIVIRRRFRDLGFGFKSSMRFSYTLSRTRDDGFVDTSSAQVQGDFASEFSRSGIDRRHKFRFTGTTQLPWWLGNLRMSPLLRIESSRPFNVSIGGSDRNLDDVGTDRPNFSGDTSDIQWVHPNDPFPASLATRFSLSPIGSSRGNLPRNAGTGPMLFLFDVNFSRQFRFGDRFKLRPQISFDNILNSTVFSFGSDFINLANAGTGDFERGFLVPSRTLRQRKIQLGLRFDF